MSFPSSIVFILDTGLNHGNIAECLHIHRSQFKGDEFVLAGFEIVEKALFEKRACGQQIPSRRQLPRLDINGLLGDRLSEQTSRSAKSRQARRAKTSGGPAGTAVGQKDCENLISRNSPSFAVALNWGIGSNA